MSRFVVYSHDKTDIESSMFRLCSCDNIDSARYIIDALKYKDTCGRCDDTGIYNYYIVEER